MLYKKHPRLTGGVSLLLTKNLYLSADRLVGSVVVAVGVTSTVTRTGSTRGHRASHVYNEVTTLKVLAVHFFDNFVGFVATTHLNKTKAFGAAGHLVGNESYIDYCTKLRENLTKFVLSYFVWKIANEKLRWIYCTLGVHLTLLFLITPHMRGLRFNCS